MTPCRWSRQISFWSNFLRLSDGRAIGQIQSLLTTKDFLDERYRYLSPGPLFLGLWLQSVSAFQPCKTFFVWGSVYDISNRLCSRCGVGTSDPVPPQHEGLSQCKSS